MKASDHQPLIRRHPASSYPYMRENLTTRQCRKIVANRLPRDAQGRFLKERLPSPAHVPPPAPIKVEPIEAVIQRYMDRRNRERQEEEARRAAEAADQYRQEEEELERRATEARNLLNQNAIKVQEELIVLNFDDEVIPEDPPQQVRVILAHPIANHLTRSSQPRYDQLGFFAKEWKVSIHSCIARTSPLDPFDESSRQQPPRQSPSQLECSLL